MAFIRSVARPITLPQQRTIVITVFIFNFCAGVWLMNSLMLPLYSVLLCHGGLIVAYSVVAEVAEFVMVAAYLYKTKTPPPSQWQ